MKIWFLLVLTFVCPLYSRPNNPCAGLPLCRLKSDFKTRPSSITSSPSRIRNFGSASKRFKPLVSRLREDVTAKLNNQEQQPKKSFVLATSNCDGQVLCHLLNPTFSSKFSSSNTQSLISNLKKQEASSSSPIAESENGATLISAVLNGKIDQAKALIAGGTDVNAKDVYGNSALHIAAQNGRIQIVKDLILNGADVNTLNNHRNTPLHLAAQNGWTDLSRILLSAKKINVNYADLHANTALHLAAQNGQIGVAKELLKAGANVNSSNSHAHIPLHLSAQNGHLDLSKLLVENNSDLEKADLHGLTPLDMAIHTSHRDISDILRKAALLKNGSK